MLEYAPPPNRVARVRPILTEIGPDGRTDGRLKRMGPTMACYIFTPTRTAGHDCGMFSNEELRSGFLLSADVP
jgi:hypothetical protein